VWWDKAWRYIYYTDLTTYMTKECGEAACDDPCCDRIVISNWVHESQVQSSRILADIAAHSFYERSSNMQKRFREGKTKLVDKRYHK
jgi:hypothetical protein